MSVLTTRPPPAPSPGHQRAQRDDPGVVLVAQRQVQDEILVARDAEPDQLVGSPRPARFGCSGADFAGDSRSPTGPLPPSAGSLTTGLEIFRAERFMVAMLRLSRKAAQARIRFGIIIPDSTVLIRKARSCPFARCS